MSLSSGASGYQKYGATTTDPSAGNIAALTNFRASTKDVIDNIKGLMQNQEGQIIKSNTQQATDMFKQQVAQKGLGIISEPIDLETALRPFGNMVDKEAVGKTILEQTNLLKNAALNTATANATGIFDESKSMTDAVKAHRQSLINAGASALYADEETAKWQAGTGKNITENFNQFKNELSTNKASEALQLLRENAHKNMSPTEAIQFATSDVHPNLVPEVQDKITAAFENKSKPLGQQTEHLAGISANEKARIALASQELMKPVTQKKAILDAAGGVSTGMQEIATKLNASIGGLGSEITKDASNGIFKGLLRSGKELLFWDEASGGDAAKAVTSNVMRIMAKDPRINYETAMAMGLQAYQLSKANTSAGKAGTVVSEKDIATTMDELAAKEPARIAASLDYVKAQDEYNKQIGILNKDSINTVQDYHDQVRRANLTGADFNALDTYLKDPKNVNFGIPATATAGIETPADADARLKALIKNNVIASEVTPNGYAKPGSQANPLGSPTPINKPVQPTQAPATPDQALNNIKQAAVVNTATGQVDMPSVSEMPVVRGFKSLFNGGLQKYVDEKVKGDVAKIGTKLSGVPSAEASTEANTTVPTRDIVKEAVDTRRGIVAGYDIAANVKMKPYAEDKRHLANVINTYKRVGSIQTSADADRYIKKYAPKSPITGDMITSSAETYGVSPQMLITILEADSSLGTKGVGVKRNNAGNVGGDSPGLYYKTIQNGVDAAAHNLSKRKIAKR